ncbi:unnamed protein product [Hermetia illucens]|uniref:SHSP domain-containing protein n=1 Tax=Hermetia illucens TaxID=343691 RepID=A0A7R8YUG9_HERIL|nr:heat shock protein 27-like [Hermetia illucens]CAD7082739.1 unnamed protein product [Hermetia illucens]
MSLIPLLFEMDPWEMRRTRRNDWDLFGLGITPREIRELMAVPRFPLEAARRAASSDLQPAIIGKDGFQVCVDVQQFRPNEITVKTVDNMVVVEGKHEERQDEHGYISRHFVRKYALPKGYDPKEVVSALSSDGVLTIKAPKPSEEQKANERIVQIQQTGPAHLHVKENASEEEKNEK